jgi:hypothetical protein
MFHKFNIILGAFFFILNYGVFPCTCIMVLIKNYYKQKNRRIKKNFLNANFKTY